MLFLDEKLLIERLRPTADPAFSNFPNENFTTERVIITKIPVPRYKQFIFTFQELIE